MTKEYVEYDMYLLRRVEMKIEDQEGEDVSLASVINDLQSYLASFAEKISSLEDEASVLSYFIGKDLGLDGPSIFFGFLTAAYFETKGFEIKLNHRPLSEEDCNDLEGEARQVVNEQLDGTLERIAVLRDRILAAQEGVGSLNEDSDLYEPLTDSGTRDGKRGPEGDD